MKELRDNSLGETQLRVIAELIGTSWPEFNKEIFLSVRDSREFLEAGIVARAKIISKAWQKLLPNNFDKVLNILLNALANSKGPSSVFGDFVYSPFGYYVAQNGCTEERLDLALNTLKEMTVYYSSELAMRPFLSEHPDRTIEHISSWINDDREQVRRLASECTRPLLPWAKKLRLDLDFSLNLLGRMRNDESDFVLRSVGNHLDDICREAPSPVLKSMTNWKQEGWHEKSSKTIIKHATRSMLRSGHPDVFDFLEMSASPSICKFLPRLSATSVAIGEPLELQLNLSTSRDEKLYVDLKLDYPSSTAGNRLLRTFVIKRLVLRGEREHKISYQIKTSPAATRSIGPGECNGQVRVNGKIQWRFNFLLRR